MKADYINPFIASLRNAFETMLGCSVERRPIQLKSGAAPLYDFSGVIGLSGLAVGTVVLSLSKELARHATGTMLLVPADEVSEEEVVDAIGELTNMVAGGAKAKLEEYQLSISLPSVVTGKDHDVRFPSNVTPLCVPFDTAYGPMVLEVGMTMAPVPAAAC